MNRQEESSTIGRRVGEQRHCLLAASSKYPSVHHLHAENSQIAFAR